MNNPLYGALALNPALVTIFYPIPPTDKLLSQDGVNLIVTEDGHYILVV